MAELPSKWLRVSSPSLPLACDQERCIIYQKIDSQCNITCTENGRAHVIEAAGIRKDSVFEKLKHVDHGKIVYHASNNCYKSYTHKKKKKKQHLKKLYKSHM